MAHLRKDLHSHHSINNTNLTNLNSKSDTSNIHLQNIVNYGGAGNNRSIGDGSSRLQVFPYAADYAGQMRVLKCDTSGRLECSVDALEVTAEQINLNTDTLEAKLDSLINYGGGGNNDLGDGQTRLQTFMYGHDGASNQRRVRVDTDGHLQVDVVSMIGGGDASAANQVTNHNKLDHLSDNLDTLETTANAIQSAVEGTLTVGSHAVTNAGTFAVQAACSGTVTANLSATDNAVLDAIAADGDAIQSKLDHLSDNLDTVETTLTAIETDQAALEVLHTATNSKLDTMDSVLDNILTKNGEIDTVLDNIKVDTEAIETAVEAIQTHTQLTTVQLFDGETVNSGGDTHTSSAHEIIKSPANGLNFLVKSSSGSVDANDFMVNFLVSADNSAYSTLNTTFKQSVNDGLFQQVRISDYVPKFIKMTITNNDFSSNSDFDAHLFY